MSNWNDYQRYNEKGKKLRFFKRYPEKLQELYRLKEEGKSNIHVARMFGLHHSTIRSQWRRYLGLGKTIEKSYGIVQKVQITKKSTCLVPDEGPFNQGHMYKDYLRIEAEKKARRLLEAENKK